MLGQSLMLEEGINPPNPRANRIICETVHFLLDPASSVTAGFSRFLKRLINEDHVSYIREVLVDKPHNILCRKEQGATDFCCSEGVGMGMLPLAISQAWRGRR